MIPGIVLVAVIILLSATGQLLLKIGSCCIAGDRIFSRFLNLPSMTAYCLFLLVTVLSVYTLREVPLKVLYATVSLTFILVPFLSALVLREKVSLRIVAASGLVVAGVVIFNILP